jgi:hypothetical protein
MESLNPFKKVIKQETEDYINEASQSGIDPIQASAQALYLKFKKYREVLRLEDPDEITQNLELPLSYFQGGFG